VASGRHRLTSRFASGHPARNRRRQAVLQVAINQPRSGGVMVCMGDGVAVARRETPASIPADRSDAVLVERARGGDHGAFTELVDRRLASTYRTALAIMGNEADARDVTQAAFVQAWTNLPGLRDPSLFAAWFGRIVVNVARTSLRGRRRRSVREVPVSSFPEDGQLIASAAAPHDERTAALDRLERAFSRLTTDDRLVLWLHHYEDLPLAAIGERIGVPATRVKSRLFTARRARARARRVEDRSTGKTGCLTTRSARCSSGAREAMCPLTSGPPSSLSSENAGRRAGPGTRASAAGVDRACGCSRSLRSWSRASARG
jgi:RNA polymerase sigma-70 factor (ECF subfamily)